MTQKELDLIADVIWFLKGYRANAGDEGCDISAAHVQALGELRGAEQDRLNERSAPQ